MTDDDKIVPFPKKEPKCLGSITLGGLVDECVVSLVFQGDDLDPQEISDALGCEPTFAMRKGQPIKRPNGTLGRLAEIGKWKYGVEAVSPSGPNHAARQLMGRFPEEGLPWGTLAWKYELTLEVLVRSFTWNREFWLDKDVLKWAVAIGAQLGVEIFSYLDDDEDEEGGDSNPKRSDED